MPGDSPDGQCVSKLGRGGWEAFGGEGQCVSEYFYQKSQLASHRRYLQPFTEKCIQTRTEFCI